MSSEFDGRYVCNRCGTTVALPEALITGELDDPEEVVCADCITPKDRIIESRRTRTDD